MPELYFPEDGLTEPAPEGLTEADKLYVSIGVGVFAGSGVVGADVGAGDGVTAWAGSDGGVDSGDVVIIGAGVGVGVGVDGGDVLDCAR